MATLAEQLDVAQELRSRFDQLSESL